MIGTTTLYSDSQLVKEETKTGREHPYTIFGIPPEELEQIMEQIAREELENAESGIIFLRYFCHKYGKTIGCRPVRLCHLLIPRYVQFAEIQIFFIEIIIFLIPDLHHPRPERNIIAPK